MKKTVQLVFRLFVIVFIIIVLYLVTVIIIGTITDYRPDSVSEIEISGDKNPEVITDSIFTFLTWNVGFCGLGAEMDFFYDGGKMVRPSSDQVNKYTDGVLGFLRSVDTVDFIFLQEVDKNSSRTNKQDETLLIREKMTRYSTSFGLNYNVKFEPIPFFNPLGKIEMGQMNLSAFQPESAQRYSYFSAYAWPKRLFMLDRCFVESRFSLQNGKELVVLNTHNSAYDADGKLREMEMPVIREKMLAEFEKGNYVVAGGDWNQNPPGFDLSKVDKNYNPVKRFILNDSLFPSDWTVAFDPHFPTNREIDTPLTLGETGVTIIDFFILSPNIELKKIKVLSHNFQFSDHEPVFMKIKLR